MKPVIGITTAIDHEGEMYVRPISYITQDYAKVVSELGGEPILLESHIDPMVAATLCDGVIISGGRDIDPELYGQTAHTDAKRSSRERTDWERRLIDACDTHERPILGVCYGMQLLNVHYGGTLFQDIKEETGSELFHGNIKDMRLHDVTIEADFLGYKKGDKAHGTHVHHQAVDTLAPGFTPVAKAEDGIIEAMIGRGHYGIQWHAELDDTARATYGEFIKRCQAQMEAPQKKRPSQWTASGLLRRFKKASS